MRAPRTPAAKLREPVVGSPAMANPMIGAMVAAMAFVGACSSPAPKPALAPEPEPEIVASAEPEPEPEPVASVEPLPAPPSSHKCGQDHRSELPIVEGKVGDGERIVRLINNSKGDVQARLLDAKLEPVFAGTLRVAAGTTGEFHVDEGVYLLRYRLADGCQVRRGAKLVLTGKRAGVEISIKPKFESGSKSNMRTVSEPL